MLALLFLWVTRCIGSALVSSLGSGLLLEERTRITAEGDHDERDDDCSDSPADRQATRRNAAPIFDVLALPLSTPPHRLSIRRSRGNIDRLWAVDEVVNIVAEKEYPAPKQLSTPTNLSEASAHKLTSTLAGLTADAFALYVKTKNFHWHVSGPQFRDLHLLFDEQADQVLGMVDVLAERARKVGGSTIKSIGHIAELKRIRDDNDAFVEPKEMLKRLTDDNLEFEGFLRNAHEVAEKSDDKATTSILEVFLDETQRRIWFLFEAGR